MIAATSTPLHMFEVTDPQEIAKIQAQRERFRMNSQWLQAHIPQVYAQHRGKHICVAGQELFIADTAPDDFTISTQATRAITTGGLPPNVASAIAGNVRELERVTLEQLAGHLLNLIAFRRGQIRSRPGQEVEYGQLFLG